MKTDYNWKIELTEDSVRINLTFDAFISIYNRILSVPVTDNLISFLELFVLKETGIHINISREDNGKLLAHCYDLTTLEEAKAALDKIMDAITRGLEFAVLTLSLINGKS